MSQKRTTDRENLTSKELSLIFHHMNLHLNHTSQQYASWALYALHIEVHPTVMEKLFMEGLHTDRVCTSRDAFD